MFQAIKSIFTTTEPVDFKELSQSGATIIDVRTSSEYSGGHIKGSKNIPLQSLQSKLNSLDTNKTYIVCCASGARSSSAKRVLESNGFENVHNGGGWQMLDFKLRD